MIEIYIYLLLSLHWDWWGCSRLSLSSQPPLPLVRLVTSSALAFHCLKSQGLSAATCLHLMECRCHFRLPPTPYLSLSSFSPIPCWRVASASFLLTGNRIAEGRRGYVQPSSARSRVVVVVAGLRNRALRRATPFGTMMRTMSSSEASLSLVYPVAQADW